MSWCAAHARRGTLLHPVVSATARRATATTSHRPYSGATPTAAAGHVEELQQAFGFCAQLVRRHDYEGYLCTLGLPSHLRSAAFAVRAFNVEIVQARDATAEAHLSELRLLYWRDQIKQLYQGQQPTTPVTRALAKLLHVARPSKMHFDRVVDTRRADLARSGPPPDVAALEAYAEGTSSAVLYLQLQSIGVQSTAADHAASHVGKAAGLAALLRGTAALSAKRRCYLPGELLLAHGVSTEQVYRGEVTEGLREVVYQCASTARAHLDHARHLHATSALPSAALPLLLPAVPADVYLTALQRCQFDPFHPSLQPGSRAHAARALWTQAALRWHVWRRSF